MDKIPVIGTAIVNNPYWLHRLFMSIDFPVENFVVFNNNGRDQITTQVEMIKSFNNPYVDNVSVCHLPANIGCSGAWNMIIKCFMNADYWIISNHDVMYEPGLLEEMHGHMSDPEIGITHAGHGGWDLFALKDWVVQKYGLFDENLYPGYCEDMDYGMRFIHDDLKRVLNCDHGYYHGRCKDYSDGSQTWRSEPEIAHQVHMAHELNKHYLHHKWNPAWQAHIEGETYKNPFDEESLPVSFTMWDLDFVRRKNLGF